jgi:hypothetical protein
MDKNVSGEHLSMLPAVVKTKYRNNTAGKEIKTENQTNLQKATETFQPPSTNKLQNRSKTLNFKNLSAYL